MSCEACVAMVPFGDVDYFVSPVPPGGGLKDAPSKVGGGTYVFDLGGEVSAGRLKGWSGHSEVRDG